MNNRKPIPVVSANRTISFAEMMAKIDKEREIPIALTRNDYADAVNLLVKLANMDCGGSRVAAQVLLSTYNGNNWHMDLTDLCHLDGAYYRAAIVVIRCRAELSAEPHTLIANGDAVFARLELDWQSYHVKSRYQSQA